MKTKAVFLDRDGVLIREEGYIRCADDMHIFPFSNECIKDLHNAGFLAIVVSNQSGVARGFFSLEDLDRMNRRLIDEIGVDGVYNCPFYEGGIVPEYSIYSHDRKPDTGMIDKAVRKYNIALEKSWMIGDRKTDVLLGKNVGVKNILIKSSLTGEADIDDSTYMKEVNDLREAVSFIISYV